jgi:hypothetical protein
MIVAACDFGAGFVILSQTRFLVQGPLKTCRSLSKGGKLLCPGRSYLFEPNAASKSAIMSLASSVPTDSLISPGEIPAARRSSSVLCG